MQTLLNVSFFINSFIHNTRYYTLAICSTARLHLTAQYQGKLYYLYLIDQL